MRALVALLVLPAFLTVTLKAQTPDNTTPQTHRPLAVDSPMGYWDDFQRKFSGHHAHLRITTTADKTIFDCDLKNIREDSIQCRNTSHGRSSYQQAEIDTVAWHHRDSKDAWETLIPIGMSGGLAYSAYVVAPILAASIPLAFFAFVFSIATIGLVCSLVYTIDEPVYVRRSEQAQH